MNVFYRSQNFFGVDTKKQFNFLGREESCELKGKNGKRKYNRLKTFFPFAADFFTSRGTFLTCGPFNFNKRFHSLRRIVEE